MNDESDDYELPRNERVVGDLVYDPDSDEVRLSIDGRLLSLRSLAGHLQSLEGFQLAIEVIDTSA